ncbi:hypothetical protein N7G274_001801 [Stereocaulon virgatum]|uniref:Uncharacterized protein n=1 Tax=Stereocaulon virgatum TaxID=373712 RepID=A0ABR4ANU6_9LECA
MLSVFYVLHSKSTQVKRVPANVPYSNPEPGGYLQWEDNDGATFNAHSPNAGTCKENSDRFFELWRQVVAKKDIEFGLVRTLHNTGCDILK